MPGDCAIRIRREDRELLVIHDPIELARAFFTGDPSSVGEGGFDHLAGKGEQNAIVLVDVVAINTTMRARSPHKNWAAITAGEAAWPAAIPLDLDLLDLDDEPWDLGAWR